MSAILTIAAVIILAASTLEVAERDIGHLAEALGASLAASLLLGAVVAARISAAVFVLIELAQWFAGGAA